jgi:hypothetical protein
MSDDIFLRILVKQVLEFVHLFLMLLTRRLRRNTKVIVLPTIIQPLIVQKGGGGSTLEITLEQ